MTSKTPYQDGYESAYGWYNAKTDGTVQEWFQRIQQSYDYEWNSLQGIYAKNPTYAAKQADYLKGMIAGARARCK